MTFVAAVAAVAVIAGADMDRSSVPAVLATVEAAGTDAVGLSTHYARGTPWDYTPRRAERLHPAGTMAGVAPNSALVWRLQDMRAVVSGDAVGDHWARLGQGFLVVEL